MEYEFYLVHLDREEKLRTDQGRLCCCVSVIRNRSSGNSGITRRKKPQGFCFTTM